VRLTAASCWSLQRDAAGAPLRILSIDDDISGIAGNATGSECQSMSAQL
jgi:hypothetical protein